MTLSCSQRPPTHDRASELEECFVYVRPALVTHAQTSELMQPGDGALDHPASFSQPTAMFGVATGKQSVNAAISQSIPMRLGIVAAIALYEVGFATRTSALAGDGRNSIHQRQQLRDVVAVSFGENDTQRNALRIAEEVVLRARLTAIGWVRSSFFPPCTARTLELSAIAREKSTLSASRSRDSNTWWRRSQTPASCHARKYRQQLIPEPQPISWGSIPQGIPDFKTNRMPVKALRGSMGLRPACRLRRRLDFGSSGSTINQSSSSTSSCAIVPHWNNEIRGIIQVTSPFCYVLLGFTPTVLTPQEFARLTR